MKLKSFISRELFFVSLFALGIIWEVTLYRKMFISFWIPLLIFVIGGLTLQALFGKKTSDSRSDNYVWAFFGMFKFGVPLMLLFMASNVYISNGTTKTVLLKALQTGTTGGKGAHEPYAIVNYDGKEKQLFLSTRAEGCKMISLSLNKGLFGFWVISKAEPQFCKTVDFRKEEREAFLAAYRELLEEAAKYREKGNRTKAIELYTRALKLYPSDTVPQNALVEMEALSK